MRGGFLDADGFQVLLEILLHIHHLPAVSGLDGGEKQGAALDIIFQRIGRGIAA